MLLSLLDPEAMEPFSFTSSVQGVLAAVFQKQTVPPALAIVSVFAEEPLKVPDTTKRYPPE